MRALTLIFLGLTFAGPALAQLKPLTPPPSAPAASAATTSPKGLGELNANGKIQIGYHKRADDPTIKQPVSGIAAKPAETNALNTAAPGNVQNPQNLNGNILDPTSGQRRIAAPTTKPLVAAAPAPVAPTATAAPTKPRSDSALRSDTSPAREAAAAAQAQTAAKAAADKAQAQAIAAAIVAAQNAGTSPTGSLPVLPTN